jgi:uncharacterized protein YndB with AHSA1/START domain
MAKVHVESVIVAPVARVWEYVRDFNGLPKWFPGVTDSHIEDGVAAGANQAGCIRNFGVPGGARIREQLVSLSDRDHSCAYKMLESPMPISNYRATVRLSPAADAQHTLAELTSEFDCAADQEKQMVAFFGKTYHDALDLLKQHFRKA